MFSKNEEFKEIATEHIKLLMVPFYQAEVLFHVMDSRAERVKLAHTYYLEYLKLMSHYDLLDKQQKTLWKQLYKGFQEKQKKKV